MDAMQNPHLQGMAKFLVQKNVLDKEKALIYQQVASDSQLSLLQYLVNNRIICPKIIASTVAHHFGIPVYDLNHIDIKSIPASLMTEKLIQRHRIVPLYTQNNQLYVATDDPSQYDALKEIQFHTGLRTAPLVVESDKLTRLINQLLHQKEHQDLAEYDIEPLLKKNGGSGDHASEDEPVVKFVKRIILDAIEQNVSDIHFEPYEQEYRIRYRLDGLLITVATPPQALSSRIAVRIKVMADLDISERRLPQDGRFRMSLPNMQHIDFRVSTCPTVCGEKIVMRILDTQSIKPDIETLGFMPSQKKLFLNAISRPQGMILVTGPTGSGKTMTLYSALAVLNTSEKNISTVEDPVEIHAHGINQVNINPKACLTFASTLRAFLRQDPDVIMLGEIRDLETAEIAVKAAQTGHLVLSTLHTNSAAESLTRLMNIGVPPFNIASSVSLIIAQRLIRQLCEACKIMRDDGLANGYQAQGCQQCSDGYRGRIALFEVMPISKPIAQMIMNGTNSLELLKQAQAEGMITIYQAGLEKIKQGFTSFEELNRIMVDE